MCVCHIHGPTIHVLCTQSTCHSPGKFSSTRADTCHVQETRPPVGARTPPQCQVTVKKCECGFCTYLVTDPKQQLLDQSSSTAVRCSVGKAFSVWAPHASQGSGSSATVVAGERSHMYLLLLDLTALRGRASALLVIPPPGT